MSEKMIRPAAQPHQTHSYTPQGGPLNSVGPGGRPDKFPYTNPPVVAQVTQAPQPQQPAPPKAD